MKSNDNKEMEQVIQSAIKSILESIGEDVNREGLIDTPRRVSELYLELFSQICFLISEICRPVLFET